MKIYLIRHGQTDWNLALKIQGTTDVPLNAKGIEQAEIVGKMFADKKEQYPVDHLYCSFLKRAHKTADVIGEHIGLKATVLEGAHELNLGDFEGLTWKQVEEKFGKVYQEWYANRRYANTPGGEAYHDAYVRMREAVKRAADQALREAKTTGKEPEGIAIVSHGGTIFAVISEITNTSFDDMEKYPIGNLSVCVTDYNPETEEWKFLSLDNDATPNNSTTVMR